MSPFLNKVIVVIVNPLIEILLGVAVIYFLYGVFQFVVHADDSEARKTGAQNIFWGLFGIFVMVAVFGIMHFIASSVSAPLQLQY